MKTIKNIKSELDNLKVDEKKLKAQLSEARSNQTWKCLCGKYHKIKDTEAVIETIWERGYGYEDGYIREKCFYLLCPKTENLHNRLLYPSYFNVNYESRQDYNFNAKEQFERNYKSLFKQITTVDEKFNCRWGNNEYIDKNHKKFEINITKC